MKRDIFIDTNVANKFANPQDIEYLRLTKWLLKFNSDDVENKDQYAHLVVSKKLLMEYYTKATEKGFRCNSEDREHIPVVLLSDRKYALSYDENLIHDLETFPGFTVLVKKRPEEIPYENSNI